MQSAERLEAKIESALVEDQGASYRRTMKTVLSLMPDPFRGEGFRFSRPIGASMIGDSCSRKIWYSYRQAKKPDFEGRILRLFQRGHLEEARVISLLLIADVEVEWGTGFAELYFGDEDVEGHLDGIVSGVPDMPGQRMVLEVKTAARSMFDKVKREGVEKAQWKHYIQMGVYARATGLAYSLYFVVCKDNDHLYTEIVPRPTDELIDRYIERARGIVAFDTPPPGVSVSGAWWECKICPYAKVCHYGEPLELNCRTCRQWKANRCTLTGGELTDAEQQIGCGSYVPIA